MLDFQQGPQPRNYFSRREQWRLLLLVMSLGLVILLAQEARDPARYAWLLADRPQPADPTETAAEPPAGEAPGGGQFEGVPADLLDGVRDDFPFLFGERDAWFHLLAVLRDTDAAALRRASIGHVTYAQMFEQPDVYRGRPLTVQGIVRRAHRLPAPANDFGFDHYYQTWMTPQDSPGNVVAVYCLGLPEGFPAGIELEEPAELVGFFFKRWVYMAQDGPRTAPVVLARSFRWQPRPQAAAPRGDDDPMGVAVIVVAAALFAVAVAAFVYYHSGGGKRRATDEPFDARRIEPRVVRPGPAGPPEEPPRKEKPVGK